MKKLILSLCMVLALTACGEKAETPKENEKPVIKIGAILPLTGNLGAIGEASKKAIMMALEDNLKESNRYNYEIVFEDNQMSPAKTAIITNKLINIDKVDALLSFFSAQGLLIAPIVEKHKVLHLCNTWESKKVKALGEYTFLQGTYWESIYRRYVNDFKKNNIKKIALFSVISGVNNTFAKGLHEELTKEGITSIHEEYNLGTRDFRMLIQKYKSQGYEHFWFIAFFPEVDILLKQLHEAGIDNSNIYAIGSECGSNYDLYEGLSLYGYNTGNAQFKDRLQMDQNYGASVSYDIISMLINSFEAVAEDSKKPEIIKIINYIKSKGSFDCVSGGCTVLPENNFIINPAAHRKFEGGKLIDIED